MNFRMYCDSPLRKKFSKDSSMNLGHQLIKWIPDIPKFKLQAVQAVQTTLFFDTRFESWMPAFGWFPLPLCLKRLHLQGSKAFCSIWSSIAKLCPFSAFFVCCSVGKNVQIWSLLLWCDVQDFAWYICAGHQRMIAICNHGVIVSTGAPYVSTVQSDHPGSWSPKFGWSLVPVVITLQVLWLDRRMAPLYWKQRSGLDTAADHATPNRLFWSGLTLMLLNLIWNMEHADLGCASQEIDTTKGPLAGLLVLYKMSRGAWVWHKILLVIWGM